MSTAPPQRPFKSLDLDQLQKRISSETSYLVQDLLPIRSVNILVGDSGIGKSPLLIQLAMCVASGRPFLSLSTMAGSVLYIDYENTHESAYDIASDICRYLDIPKPSSHMYRWYSCPNDLSSVASEIRAFHPSLVIVDALRGLDPTAEKDNTAAANRIVYLQRLAQELNCVFVLLHHLRKQDEENPSPPLSAAPTLMSWLERASGARSLINQTDTRIGIDLSIECDLIMRWHFKARGESGLWRIRRVIDQESGEPIAYERITGVQLLRLQPDRDLYARLPDEFHYKLAKSLGGRGDKATARFLHEAVAAGILTKSGRRKETTYRKSQ